MLQKLVKKKGSSENTKGSSPKKKLTTRIFLFNSTFEVASFHSLVYYIK